MKTVAALAVAFVFMCATSTATAASLETLKKRDKQQTRSLYKHAGTKRFFANHPWLLKYGPEPQRWAARRALKRATIWVRIIQRERAETRAAIRAATRPPAPSPTNWVARQIAIATIIGRASPGDPWPNCPDPFDGRGSWTDTVNCENGGNWYDSPGYYRCGLQFDPGWEQKYGRLCP